MIDRDREAMRSFLRRRLMSLKGCAAFNLIGWIEGKSLGLARIEVKPAQHIDDAITAIVDEIEEQSASYAALEAGRHRFRVEARTAPPEAESLGAQEFIIVTPGEVTAPPVEQPPAALAPYPKASGNDAVSAALVKMALDHSAAYARLLLGTMTQTMTAQQADNNALRARCAALETEQMGAYNLIRAMLLTDTERTAITLAARGKEDRKNRLVDAAEALIPFLQEQMSGEGPIHALLQSLDVEKLQALAAVLSPEQRAALDKLLKRKAERETANTQRETVREARKAEIDHAFERPGLLDKRGDLIEPAALRALFPQLGRGGDA